MSRSSNLSNTGKYKETKNLRQGQIYNYFRRQLYQTKQQDFLASFPKAEQASLVSSLYKSQKLTRAEHNQILKQTNQAYREERSEQESQLRYYKDKIGTTNLRSKEFTKTEQFKYFWLARGEHRQFRQKKLDFDQELARLRLAHKGQRIKNRSQLLKIYQLLYEKSPWRIRDRFLTTTNHPGTSYNFKEVVNKYVKHNPFPHTAKYYRQAVQQLLRKTEPYGEKVPEDQLVLNRYGQPQLSAGQVMTFNVTKPGRQWTIYRNIPDLKEVVQKEVHEVAHQDYIEGEGTPLEIQTWKLKKNKALCWVEAMGLGSCAANQGTSNWWCLECIYYGEYHPPVLPKHCPWLYTYKSRACGSTQHADSNKQWHFSVEGEKRREKVKGGDWGSCHIATFAKTRKTKTWRKK